MLRRQHRACREGLRILSLAIRANRATLAAAAAGDRARADAVVHGLDKNHGCWRGTS